MVVQRRRKVVVFVVFFLPLWPFNWFYSFLFCVWEIVCLEKSTDKALIILFSQWLITKIKSLIALEYIPTFFSISFMVVSSAKLVGFVLSLSITQQHFCFRVPWREEAAEKCTKKKKHSPRYVFQERAICSKIAWRNSKFLSAGVDGAIGHIN